MKNQKLVSLIITCAFFTGCATQRSISHSGYRERPSGWEYHPAVNDSDPAFNYQGELSEFDVLGITRNQIASEVDIARALDAAKAVELRDNSSILLIQSGAMFPDGPMIRELSKHLAVTPFSGVPPYRRTNRGLQTESLDPESYSKSLRLAAARGGNDVIVCYWGLLESESEKMVTKTVSWVPLVNWALPDEQQHMRIRLKIALIDVRTGNWAVFSPEPFDDKRSSSSLRRGVVDQKQVEDLKAKAYAAGAKGLLEHYSNLALAE